MKKLKYKMQKGITLPALIITVVLLMVLAGISIGISHNQGIVEHADNTAEFIEEKYNERGEAINQYKDYLNE